MGFWPWGARGGVHATKAAIQVSSAMATADAGLITAAASMIRSTGRTTLGAASGDRSRIMKFGNHSRRRGQPQTSSNHDVKAPLEKRLNGSLAPAFPQR